MMDTSVRIRFCQYGARPHQIARHDRGAEKFLDVLEMPTPATYRQIIEKGQRVPLDKQIRRVPEENYGNRDF